MTLRNKSSSNVLVNPKFYERLVNNHTQRIANTMNQAMTGKQADANIAELVASVSSALGDMSARLEIVELALISEPTTSVGVPKSIVGIDTPITDTSQVMQRSHDLPDSVTLLSDALSMNANFHQTESTNGNLEYNWTGEAVATDIELLVSRNTEKELRVRIVNTLKSDALQTLRIKIDGQDTPHQPMYDGELSCILATLPAAPDKTSTTLITIVYPETCTPVSLGLSTDTRHLGMAINSIQVCDGLPGDKNSELVPNA